MEIFDFHVHPFLNQQDNKQWYKRYGQLQLDEYRSELERIGIKHICGSIIKRGLSPEEMVRSANDNMLALMQEWKGFYLGGMQVHPDCVEFSCSEIERMHKQGVRLIGETTPYLHGWSDYATLAFDEILELAAEKEMVFSFHRALNIEQMFERHKNLTIVKAHPESGEELEEVIRCMKKYDNICLDICGTGVDIVATKDI